jgi:hypothetical protein
MEGKSDGGCEQGNRVKIARWTFPLCHGRAFPRFAVLKQSWVAGTRPRLSGTAFAQTMCRVSRREFFAMADGLDKRQIASRNSKLLTQIFTD